MNTTTVSPSTVFRIFSGQKFFVGKLLAKKINFQNIWRAQAIFFSPVFTINLEMLMVFGYFIEHFSVEWCAVIVLAKIVFGQFLSKKEWKFLNFFKTDSTFPIADYAS